MTRDSQGFFVADGLSFTVGKGPVVILRPVGLGRAFVYDELFGDPEWDDVEEWFNTYKELEREEEEHG